MKFLFKSILFLVLFTGSFLVFLSKEKVYNLLEKELQEYEIIISNEKISENYFGIGLNEANISKNKKTQATIENINFTSYILFTKINAKNILLDKSFGSNYPRLIETFNLKHSISSFNALDIQIKGKFGLFLGKALLFDKKIVGELIPSKKAKIEYRNFLNEFKFEEGKYKYEFKY